MWRMSGLVVACCLVGAAGLGCDALKGNKGGDTETIKAEPESASKPKSASKAKPKRATESDGKGLAEAKDATAAAKVDDNSASPAGVAGMKIAADTDVAGDWVITSASNAGGGSYGGSVAIKKNGQYFDLKWAIDGGEGYGGVGLVRDSVLGVGWGTGSNFGVVVYKIEGGRLKGEWASSASQGKLGTEVLEGPEGVAGRYKIVVGISPDTGLAYTGSVDIVPTGAVHNLSWKLDGGESYSGAGLVEGQWLIVGWGRSGGAGVVRYKIKGRELKGTWAQPGAQSLGTENLKRR